MVRDTILYDLLCISPNATEVEIKKGYRKVALIYHPDKPTGDEEKFKEICNAFEILSDSKKKKNYDKYGIDGTLYDSDTEEHNNNTHKKRNQRHEEDDYYKFSKREHNMFNSFFSFDENFMNDRGFPNDDFFKNINEFFNNDKAFHHFENFNNFTTTHTFNYSSSPMSSSSSSSFSNTQFFYSKDESNHRTNSHRFSNLFPNFSLENFPNISSDIELFNYFSKTKNYNMTISLEDIFFCRTKYLNFKRLSKNGSFEKYTAKLKLKPHYRNDKIITIHNKGDFNPFENRRNPIYVTLKETVHPVFKREDIDTGLLSITIPVTLKESLIGFEKTIRSIDGSNITLTKTNLLKPNTEVTYSEFGMLSKKTGERGDLVIRFDIEYPDELTEEQIDAVNEVFD